MAAEVAKAGKIASQYFEKIDKSVLYHAGALNQTDWLLCPGKEDQNAQPSILLQGTCKPCSLFFSILILIRCSCTILLYIYIYM